MNSPTIYACTNGRAIYDATAGAGGFEPCPEYLRGFTLDPGHCAICLQDLTPIPYGEQIAAPLTMFASPAREQLRDVREEIPNPPVLAQCTVCGHRWAPNRDVRAHGIAMDVCGRGNPPCMGAAKVVTVFTEDEVRPLWDALVAIKQPGSAVMWGARDGVHARQPVDDALDAFPAPESWR